MPAEALAAYDFVLRGKDHHHRYTREDCEKAIDMFERAIERDPDYAVAHAWLACGLGQARAYHPEENDALIARAEKAAERARVLDDEEAECYRVLANVAILRNDPASAETYQERGLALNPNDDRSVAAMGQIHCFRGRHEESHHTLFIGIDLGRFLHQVCVLDANGRSVGEQGFAHNFEGLSAIADWLLALAARNPKRIAVALENPHGPVVEILLESGLAVFAINPKQVDRFRDRHSMSGAKDDRRDAFVIADALRTDGHRFHRLQLPPPELIAMRGLLSTREQLIKNHVALSSQIRDSAPVVLASLLSYAHDPIRLRSLEALRSLGGVAPVTQQSGKRRQVLLRRARSLPLNNALHHWARIAVLRDSRFKEHHERLRGRGHTHARALRGVMDRILPIAVAALRDRTLYDPSRNSTRS